MKYIGRYAILGRLGRGGMGAVYKAAMPVTGKIVALKTCEPAEILVDLMGRERLAELFFREAAIMARIRHPNIAGVWDAGEADGVPFYTMEYFCNNVGAVIGETYRVEEPTRRLPPDVALDLARQVLLGLRRLHAAGIVHRDVKPFNMLLADREGGSGEGLEEVKLIDLGLSRVRGETFQRPKGMVVGSPYYAAPEQERDPDCVDGRADVFAVGVTLFRMLTGRLPNESPDCERRAGAVRPELGDVFDDLLLRTCAEDPAARPVSASALLAELDEVAARWGERRDATCSLYEPEDGSPCERRLRSEPVKIRLRDARDAFGLDALWRPVLCLENDFVEEGAGRGAGDVGAGRNALGLRNTAIRAARRPGGRAPDIPRADVPGADGGTVLDRATGLVWQRSGSPYALDWDGALAYVAALNARRFAGRADWRLPTVPEVCSLLRPADEPGRYCVESVFDPDAPRSRTRLWTADRKAFTAAWYADTETGFVWWQDMTCSFSVRAVAG